MGLPDQVELPYARGYDIGIGVNYASGGPKNKAVMGAISPPEIAGGDITRFKIQRVFTTSEIEQVLQIAATASYGVAAFAGAEARFAFARSAKVQSSSLVMLVYATVQRAFQQIDEVTLTPAASDVVGQPAVFAERYGNVFVRGINSGGLFVGYYRIDTGSAEISDQISLELEGSYGLFSGDAETKFKTVQRKYRSEVAIDIYREGGPTNLLINSLEDPLELLRNVKLFLSSFQDRPDQVAIPYSVTLSPLTIANGPTPPNEVDLQHAQDVLIFCAKRRSTLVDQLNTLQYIVDKPHRFELSDPNRASLQEISRAAQGAQSDLDLIARCASHAMNDPKTAMFPENFATSIDVEYPQTAFPENLPDAKPIQLRAPNAMPNLVGAPAEPVVSLLACIQMEGVDHCLGFLGSSLGALGTDPRPLADFFFLVMRSGARPEVRGDAGPPGAIIRAQFPPEGVEVTPGAVFILEI
jgi:hypothetical protein